MNCKTYRTEIDDANPGGHLSAGTEAHLRQCEECRNFSRERQSLRRLVGELEPVVAPPDFEFRLRARLAATAGSQNRRSAWATFAPGAVSIALAACFALSGAMVLRFKYQGVSKDVAVESPDAAARRPATNGGGDAARTVTNERVDAARSEPGQMPDADVARESNIGVGDGAMDEGTAGDFPAGGVAGVRTVSNGRRRAMTARENNFASYSRAGERRLEAATFNVRSVAVNRLGTMEAESSRAGNELPFAVPVRTPTESMKIVLRDERGASRVVSIDPVSFGAQEIVGRKGVTTNVSLQSSEGVW